MLYSFIIIFNMNKTKYTFFGVPEGILDIFKFHRIIARKNFLHDNFCIGTGSKKNELIWKSQLEMK